MPTLLNVEEFAIPLLSEGRSPGLHVSDVIRVIAKVCGWLKQDRNGQPDELDVDKVCLGQAWEEWIVKRHPEVHHQPGEATVDGIPMTPDGLSYEHGYPTLREFKLTWKSARHPIVDQQMWMMQAACYCRGIRELFGPPPDGKFRVVFHVYWVNADYQQFVGCVKRYKVYYLEFTEAEVNEVWHIILSNWRRLNGSTNTQ